jgi:uracil-DNA glycosylase family 4
MRSRENKSIDLDRALERHCHALGACRRCNLEPDVLPIVSMARRPRVILVGQAPGKVETGGGRAFAGRAGKTLFRWFQRVGLDEDTARQRIYIAAVTRCYPGPSPSGRGDRVPSLAERANCTGWLDDELALIRPRLLIPVGRLAIERFLPRLRIGPDGARRFRCRIPPVRAAGFTRGTMGHFSRRRWISWVCDSRSCASSRPPRLGASPNAQLPSHLSATRSG